MSVKNGNLELSGRENLRLCMSTVTKNETNLMKIALNDLMQL